MCGIADNIRKMILACMKPHRWLLFLNCKGYMIFGLIITWNSCLFSMFVSTIISFKYNV